MISVCRETKLPIELQYKEYADAIRVRGGWAAFQEVQHQHIYADTSLIELSAYVAWTYDEACIDPTTARVTWGKMDSECRQLWVPDEDPRLSLKKYPTWKLLIAKGNAPCGKKPKTWMAVEGFETDDLAVKQQEILISYSYVR